MRRLLLVDEVLFRFSRNPIGTELTTDNSLTLALKPLRTVKYKGDCEISSSKTLQKHKNRRIFSALSFRLIGVLLII